MEGSRDEGMGELSKQQRKQHSKEFWAEGPSAWTHLMENTGQASAAEGQVCMWTQRLRCGTAQVPAQPQPLCDLRGCSFTGRPEGTSPSAASSLKTTLCQACLLQHRCPVS